MTIQEIYDQLCKQCQSSKISIQTVNTTDYLVDEVKKNIRDLVVKQAFIGVVTQWEHFLEDTAIAYSLGEASLKGQRLEKYISPIDSDHANRLIKGTAIYPDWSDMDKVKDIAQALFKDGEPYLSAINGFSSKYGEIKKLRNVIVHNSVKSRGAFDSLVRNALRASSVGISPVEFLLSKKGKNPLFYDMYITYIENAANIIANSTAIETEG